MSLKVTAATEGSALAALCCPRVVCDARRRKAYSRFLSWGTIMPVKNSNCVYLYIQKRKGKEIQLRKRDVSILTLFEKRRTKITRRRVVARQASIKSCQSTAAAAALALAAGRPAGWSRSIVRRLRVRRLDRLCVRYVVSLRTSLSNLCTYVRAGIWKFACQLNI